MHYLKVLTLRSKNILREILHTHTATYARVACCSYLYGASSLIAVAYIRRMNGLCPIETSHNYNSSCVLLAIMTSRFDMSITLCQRCIAAFHTCAFNYCPVRTRTDSLPNGTLSERRYGRESAFNFIKQYIFHFSMKLLQIVQMVPGAGLEPADYGFYLPLRFSSLI